jgi:serine/threonine protein kinase
MKIIEKEGFTTSMYKALVNEVGIQKRIIHNNIIRVRSYVESSKRLYIIMEYASKGSLFKLLRKKERFTEREAFYFFIQICSAIHFLHKHKVMHRDIKPENLLLTKEGVLKLCDFGCCTRYTNKTKVDYCGTVEYMAPEVLRHEVYDEKIDVWSLGVLLYEMLHGHTPYQERVINRHLPKPFFNKLSEDIKELIEALLDNDASRRPEVWEIFNYPWVKRMQREFQIKDNTIPNKTQTLKDIKRPISRSLVYRQPIKNAQGDPIVEFKDDLYTKRNQVISNTTLDTICESKATEVVFENKKSSYKKDRRLVHSLVNPISLNTTKKSTCENSIKEVFVDCMCEEATASSVKASGFRVSINRLINSSCMRRVKVLKEER